MFGNGDKLKPFNFHNRGVKTGDRIFYGGSHRKQIHKRNLILRVVSDYPKCRKPLFQPLFHTLEPLNLLDKCIPFLSNLPGMLFATLDLP